MTAEFAGFKYRVESGWAAQSVQFEIILAKLSQVATPTVQRKDIVFPQAKENGKRWYVEVEMFEKGFDLHRAGSRWA